MCVRTCVCARAHVCACVCAQEGFEHDRFFWSSLVKPSSVGTVLTKEKDVYLVTFLQRTSQSPLYQPFLDDDTTDCFSRRSDGRSVKNRGRPGSCMGVP